MVVCNGHGEKSAVCNSRRIVIQALRSICFTVIETSARLTSSSNKNISFDKNGVFCISSFKIIFNYILQNLRSKMSTNTTLII